MKLKYVPNPYGYLRPARATTLDEFFDDSFKELPELLENLFSKAEVVEAIKKNDFLKVFEACELTTYTDKSGVTGMRGCNPLLLCHFFYLLDIDFMPYLPYEYIKKNILRGKEWEKEDKEKYSWDEATYFEEVEE